MKTNGGARHGNAERSDRWGRGSRLLGTGLMMMIVAGCTSSSTNLVHEPLLQVSVRDGLVFMTQNHRTLAGMEALFVGPVRVDDDGCIRLGSEDDATVVWPVGYTLDTSGDVVGVLDEQGDLVGQLGGEFELAGGEVDVLPAAMGFTDEDRERARACPGRYWIVNADG